VTVEIVVGECREVMRALDPGCVQTVMTSFPYYGLRAYGLPPLAWGGDPACAHDFEDRRYYTQKSTAHSRRENFSEAGPDNAARLKEARWRTDGLCRCGAWRGDFGLEPTYDLYVEHAVEVARDIARVLRPDGTFWLNLGDTYASGAGSAGEQPGGGPLGSRWKGERGYRGARLANGRGGEIQRVKHREDRDGTHAGKHVGMTAMGPMTQPNRMPQPGLRPKSLIGVPWRVALALQEDGWILRRDVIWHKPAPMPESALDRCTTAHEYLFHFALSDRPRLWVHRDRGAPARVYSRPAPDWRWVHRETGEEVAEPREGKEWRRVNLWGGRDYYYDRDAIAEESIYQPVDRPAAGWDVGPGGHSVARADARDKRRRIKSLHRDDLSPDRKGNGAHPGTRPTFRAVRETRNKRSVWTISSKPFLDAHFATFPEALVEPCVLAGSPPGGLVLDPFAGSGTVGLVAQRLGRDALLIEMNPEYAGMAGRRIARARLGPVEGQKHAAGGGAPVAELPLFAERGSPEIAEAAE
jgi:hypothetical protein